MRLAVLGALALAACGAGEAVPPRPAEALRPVRVQGERFQSGDRPWFLTTNFLTAGEPGRVLTHTYLADDRSDRDRGRMRRALHAEGYNAIFIYTLNGGDYRSRTTPYRDRLIGGAFDDAKLARWRAELETLVAEGLRPVLWLFADDSPELHRAAEDELRRYVDRMVGAFDDLPILWVLGLELDEYWSRERSDSLGAHLASRARQPVGVHQTPGRVDYMQSEWVEFAVYQYERDSRAKEGDATWESVYEETLAQRRPLAGKPFLAAEYAWHVGGRAAQERGLAAAFAGAAGAGNGAPPGLADFVATLPDRLDATREGSRLRLAGPGLRAEADLEALTFRCSGCADADGAGPP